MGHSASETRGHPRSRLGSILNDQARADSVLKTERPARGISQEALAELVGLHWTYVGSVERRERNIAVDTMEALANAMGLDVSELLRCSLQNLLTALRRFAADDQDTRDVDSESPAEVVILDY